VLADDQQGGAVVSDTPAIDARGLVKRFDGVSALDGLDMRVETGQVRGLVGPNGAGKTTLLRVMFGLVALDSGSMRILGDDWDGVGSGTIQGISGFVEEPRFYPYLSARRNLELLARLDGHVERDRVDDVLDTVKLSDRRDRKVGAFSSGMRQRLGLAASLLRSPRLLLLDEPSVGLDPTSARDMRQLLRGLALDGTTILLSSHNMNELDGLCDSVTVMRSGRAVWDGSMERLRSEAPSPAHRMSTSDDHLAIQIAGSERDVKALPDPDGGLVVEAGSEALDAYVIALGGAGVAVRRLELLTTALESLFFELTGARSVEDAAERDRADEARAPT
jgi:ABC-2 type transport system ATP-binding protein